MTIKKSSFIPIDEILKSSLKQLNLDSTFLVYPIWKKWGQIVGDAIATKTHPDYITGQTLVVSVSNSVWLNELEMQKTSILKKILDTNPALSINKIKFRLAKSSGH